MALQQNKIKDIIVDEHSLLPFIAHNAEREKLNRRGQPIPGTRLGAVSSLQIITALKIHATDLVTAQEAVLWHPSYPQGAGRGGQNPRQQTTCRHVHRVGGHKKSHGRSLGACPQVSDCDFKCNNLHAN